MPVWKVFLVCIVVAGCSRVASATYDHWELALSHLKRQYHVMARLDDNAVGVFGGMNEAGIARSAWVLDSSGSWRELPADPSAPIARANSATAALGGGVTLMFGGYTTNITSPTETDVLLDDLWQLTYTAQGLQWQSLEPSGDAPGPRMLHAMAAIHDTSGSPVGAVVHGGLSSADGARFALNDTWVYFLGNSSWSSLGMPSAPSPRSAHGMASMRDCSALLFGGMTGLDQGHEVLDDAWVFDMCQSTWTPHQRKAHNKWPSRRSSFAMDRIDDTRIALFGGFGESVLSDLWFFHTADLRWEPFKKPGNHPMGAALSMVMARSGTVVLFGGFENGDTSDQTWSFSERWTNYQPAVTPPSRSQHAASSALNSSSVVMFGGEDRRTQTEFGDTWVFQVSGQGVPSWANVTRLGGPRPRANHAIAPVTEDAVLLFGGRAASKGAAGTGLLGDTWVYNFTTATWSPVETAQPPEPRDFFAMTNSGHGEVVLFGGNAVSGVVSNTFRYRVQGANGHGNWEQLHTVRTPGRRWGHAMASCVGRVVVFGGRTEADAPIGSMNVLCPPNTVLAEPCAASAESYYWNPLTPNLSAAGVPPARSGHAMVSLGRNKVLIFGGLSASGYLDDLWVLQAAMDGSWWELDLRTTSIQSPPARSLLVMASLGNSTAFLHGGMIYNHAYQFGDTWTLPLGCSPGHFAHGSEFESATCESCAKGTYADAHDRSLSCTPCPGNSTTEGTGAWREDMCNVCDTSVCSNQPCRLHNFVAECVCDPKFFGSDCSGSCERLSDDCHDNGHCEDGAGHNGTCSCGFWFGPAHLTNQCEYPLVGGVVGAVVVVGVVTAAGYFWKRSRAANRRRTRQKHVQEQELAQRKARLEGRVQALHSYARVSLPDDSFRTQLGVGGYGEVWSGTVAGINQGKPVALKALTIQPGDEIPRMDNLQNVFQNADVDGLLALGGSEHIVKLYGVGFTQRNRYPQIVLVMELVPGGSLHDHLVRSRASGTELPWTHRMRVLLDAASGLHYMHSSGFVHADIKSDNVLVDNSNPGQWRGKLNDMGLVRQWRLRQAQERVAQAARRHPRAPSDAFGHSVSRAHSRYQRMRDAEPSPSFSAAMSVPAPTDTPVGSLPWIAPELFDDHPVPSFASDVYSFGVLLWEVLQCTGEVPREHVCRNDALLRDEVTRGVPLKVDDAKVEAAPLGIASLIGECTALDPSARGTMASVRERLHAMTRELQSRPTSPPV